MSVGDDLYREIILDHYKSKKHRKRLDPVDYHHEGANPSCGDDIELYLNSDEGLITEVTYEGIGCSICLASADMLCESLKGRSVDEARDLLGKVKGMLTRQEEPEFSDEASDIEAMQGVRDFPVRVKCALLSWNTLDQILGKMGSETASE
ncbi:MAG: SUF system NifU family Fe-S cluster assembly protein [Spirochaetales bacterium]|nr:MAG: SUF system NifU family Fe-S cluster assembly protein [Spirochaetales bacterium]